MDTLVHGAMINVALRGATDASDIQRSKTRPAYGAAAISHAQRSPVFPYGNTAYRDAMSNLIRIRDYQHGWDSYNGSAISPRAVQAAMQLLALLADSLPPVSVVAASSGGIQIELQSGPDVEIHIEPDGSIMVYRDQPGEEMTESRIVLDYSILSHPTAVFVTR